MDITKVYKTFVLLQLLSTAKEELSAASQTLCCSYSTLSHHYALGFSCFQTACLNIPAYCEHLRPGTRLHLTSNRLEHVSLESAFQPPHSSDACLSWLIVPSCWLPEPAAQFAGAARRASQFPRPGLPHRAQRTAPDPAREAAMVPAGSSVRIPPTSLVGKHVPCPWMRAERGRGSSAGTWQRSPRRQRAV